MMIMRVRVSLLVTAVLAALAVAPPVAAFERAGDRKILVFAGRQEVPTIDPSVKYDWSIRMAQQSLYDALVKYVGNPPQIVPWLAERWESTPDAKTWTFHLVKNARFHNGDPVTAEAVRFSFARTLKLKRWEQGVLYELEAVDNYWKGWPSKDHVGGVIYKIVREAGAQRAALLRGEADIVEGLSTDDFDQVAKMPGIVVPNFPGMTTFGIKMNTQKGPTKDPNFRKAVCYAFDYDALVKIYNGHAVLETSPFPNATRGHVAVPGIYRQDLAKAKEFLAKSASPHG